MRADPIVVTPVTSPFRLRRLDLPDVAPVAAALDVVVGSVVLIGWAINVPVAMSVVPGLVKMNPLTAICFVLAGTSLWLQRQPQAEVANGQWARRVSFGAAVIVTLVGLITLAGYFIGRNFGLDQVLFSNNLEGNRIAPNTGFNFLAIGISLLFLASNTDRGHRAAQVVALLSGGVALLAVVGYAYGADYLFGVGSFIPMALNSAVAFVVLDVGILASRPSVGIAALARSDTTGGAVLRRLLPAIVIAPILFGWVRLLGDRAGLYDPALGTALVAVVTATVLGAVVFALARALDRTDLDRRRSDVEQYRFLTLSLDMVCIAGLDGYFRRLNPAFERTLGFSNDELLADPFLSFVHPEDQASTLLEVEKLATGISTIRFENRYRCKDGSYRWLAWTCAPADGQLYAVPRDITEQRLIDAALRLREQAIGAASDGIIISDPMLPDNPIIDVNPAFERLTGYTAAEVVGRNCRFLQGPETDPAAIQEIRRLIGEQQAGRVTLLNYRKDGTTFWNSISLAPVFDPMGQLRNFVGVQTDVSETYRIERVLTEAKEAAEETSRLKSSFLSTMSHELRTPMTSIKGYVELLLDGEVGDLTAEQRSFLGVVSANTDRLAMLINDVLDLSKIEAGRMEITPEAVDLARIVAQVGAELEPLAAAKGLAFGIDIPTRLPVIDADPLRIHQIILNLAANAVKFTDAGRVAVAVHVVDDRIEVAVSDTGIGIAAESLAYIFDEFRQADDGVTRRFGGTGLGLSISSKLAKLHGGAITVTSVLGAGSTFTLHLPVVSVANGVESRAALDAEGLVIAPSDLPPRQDANQPVVLLIEDDVASVAVIRHMVEVEGCRLVHAADGATGMRLAALLQPELVLLDIVLAADLDGWQVLHGLRSLSATCDLPVVIVSALEDRQLAATLGATDYLVKPVVRAALSAALHRFKTCPPAEILIVDDDSDVRLLLARMLTDEGFQVRLAAGGKEALRENSHRLPNLIVLDLMMPNVDGFSVLAAVRAEPSTQDLPVLVVTAMDMSAADLAWLGQNTVELLTKSSLSTEVLLTQVRAALNDHCVATSAPAHHGAEGSV